MSSKNTTQVLIAGKIITISGYESEEYLQKVANYLNNKITELSELPGYHRQPVETKNTLLCLNLADDYFKAKRQAEIYEDNMRIKDRELYELKHELITMQMKLDELKKDADRTQKEFEQAKQSITYSQEEFENIQRELEQSKLENIALLEKNTQLESEVNELLI